MEQVRSVQKSFYSSSPSISQVQGDIVENLPLYQRIGPTELPGRSTIIYVADPRHTHMFEAIIRGGDQPWYAGQIYTPALNYKDFGRIEGWRSRKELLKGEINATKKSNDGDGAAVVVGTLLRIVDYRRVNDGRMVLLTHGLERFVVERPRQDQPYPVADVRCLPDIEDTDAAVVKGYCSRQEARNRALEEALLETECNLQLPGHTGSEISVEDLVGADLESYMPLAPFSTVAPERLPLLENGTADKKEEKNEAISIEMELMHYGIMEDFPSFRKELDTNENTPSSDDMERSLWICIDEYVRIRGVGYGVLPRELLKLLPPGVTWPENFVLKQYAQSNGLIPSSEGNCDFGSEHQAQRRQRRLSYGATVLLGGKARSTGLLNRGMRQKLLEVPSTAGRLWAVLECFDEFFQLAR